MNRLPPVRLTIAQLSEKVSKELASLRTFESYPMPESFERRRTLEIRRDEKTIHVLGRIMSLAAGAGASQGRPERDDAGSTDARPR